jgi:photosystem II stability/assembly factor-like uncharacterized protein
MAAFLLGFIVCLLFAGLEPAQGRTKYQATQPSIREPLANADAPLRALMMVDQKEGWAVGDDGLILHTIDGWETLERQTTHVRASLRSVHFVDAYQGWAVGSEVLPFGHGTQGVVLGTTDGGVRWEKLVYKDAMPGLCAVRFIDAEKGFAFGDTTGGNASGVFMSVNGGRTWRSLPTEQAQQGWTCGTLLNDQPVCAGPLGQIGALEKDSIISLPPQIARSQVYWRDIAANGQDAWLVGSQAAVMVSRQTNGKSWEAVSLGLSESLQRSFDFDTVCCKGDHIWIAGRPGSVILHSGDNGKSWELQPTGQSLPLHAIRFITEAYGWAIGEMGTILQTTDGGKSWTVRRRGGHRAALMTVVNQCENLPVGTMAIVGGDQGYLATTLQVTHQPGHANADAMKIQQAMRTVGGMTAEVLTYFPVADYQEFMEGSQLAKIWAAGKSQAGESILEEQLVLALRVWRPSLVVCGCSSEATPVNNMIATAMKRACELSGQADVFPEQLTKLNLQPWQPSRLFAYCPRYKNGCVQYNLDEPQPVLFASANDFANLARPILFDKFVPGPFQERYKLEAAWGETHDPNKTQFTAFSLSLLTGLSPEIFTRQRDLFQGLTLGYGGQARREKVEVDQFQYEMLKQATIRQAVESMTYRAKMADPAEKKQFFSNFEHSLKGLAPLTVGDRIFAQAQEFADKGQWTMARECHLMLLDLLPTHRLAPESCRFILTTMGSGEMKRRVELHTMETFAEYPLRLPTLNFTDAEGNIDLNKVVKPQRSALQRRKGEIRRWHQGALAAGELLSLHDRLCYYEPSLQFCLQANMRQEGNQDQSQLWQTSIKSRQSTGPWFEAADAELWLGQRIGSCPKTTLHSMRFTSTPKLDGKLDDDCWKNAQRVHLQKAAGDIKETTEAMLGYDDQYLYLGVRCQQAKDAQRLAPVKPRQRDADLRQFDRISLMLDLDRDYNTYFHFEFDQRGCVSDDCCGDLTWNPKWYIEVSPEADGWTAEVAIPLIELTGETKLIDKVWAMNISRIVPNQGVQSVSLPAGVKPKPEGMGLLMFDGDPVKPAAFGKP